MSLELDDAIYNQITAHAEKGNELSDAGRYREALAEFETALRLIPEPLADWEASTWVLSAMGDCYFFLNDYESAHGCFNRAVRCPGGLGNWFIHLRLGETQYELGNEARARDELARAYMGGGKEAFANEDPKYLHYLRRHMKHI